MNYDVAIIGSGPAGSSAAYHLARSGARVLIIEKSSQPRYKTCGGGLVGRGVRHVFAAMDGVVQRECKRVDLHLNGSGLHFSSSRPSPIIIMTMRKEFDFLLMTAAKGAGASVVTNCEVTTISPGSIAFRLETTAGVYSANFIVAADGAGSQTARKCGWDTMQSFMPALEYEVFVDDVMLQRYSSSARFDVDLVPHGYGWVFPKAKHLSVGVLTTRKHSVNLNDSISGYLHFLDLDKGFQTEKHGFMIPLRPTKTALARNRVMLVGDAAGLVDPVTGEGISFAIRSGELAAEALIESGFAEPHAADMYCRKLSAEILPEIRYGTLVSRLFYDFPRLRNRIFRNTGGELTEAITDVMMGEKTYRKMFHRPMNYFKLLMPH